MSDPQLHWDDQAARRTDRTIIAVGAIGLVPAILLVVAVAVVR